jgi:adenosyl cobinamide kinase/adenosyl cobinamide phosphate guanylyltransferase
VALLLISGGVRSGKSRTAVQLASGQDRPVHFLATAEGRDRDMEERIARHQSERPPSWATIEEPLRLREMLIEVPLDDCLVIDCLNLWTSNSLEHFDPLEIEHQAYKASRIAAKRVGHTIVVTNEVGLGVVPANDLARVFVDLLGRVNTTWAEVADHMILMIAGRALSLTSTSLPWEPLNDSAR